MSLKPQTSRRVEHELVQPNTWSPDGKAVFVNILIGVVITGLELLRQWQEERGDFDGDDGDLWR